MTGATSVTTTKIGSKHYALVASNADNGVQIIDISAPDTPISVANITDGEGGFGELYGATSVTTTKIGSKHYALVASNFDSSVQIIDISAPDTPISVASITDGEGGFGALMAHRLSRPPRLEASTTP